jgi:FAD/FMN-containing dehydrogenase
MPQLISVDVENLRKNVAGSVFSPEDPGYDDARRMWNGQYDRRPAVVVQAVTAADVSSAITFAREHDLEISVRGGAHSTGGLCVIDGSVHINLSLMNSVTVDPQTRRCRVGGGALLGDRDTATQEHGLAAPAGIVGHTGVGGLTLGGGMGWLTRKHGLSIDNLISAEVVTADGRIRTASPEEEPDLFWAIRGGGGNFGVVTSFEFQLHPVGPIVQFGLFFWPLEQVTDVLRLTREVVATLAPELNVMIAGVNAPPAPFVPAEHQGRPGIMLLVTGFGPEAEHAELVDRIRRERPPLVEMVTPIPYAQLQQMFDEANAWGLLAYDKAIYVKELSDDVIAVVADQLPRKSSPHSAMFFFRLDGAYSEVGDDATAFSGGRTPRFTVFLLAVADNHEAYRADRDWVRGFWDALLPLGMGKGSYVNGETEFPEDRVRASYGEAKYERLARIKAAYDPDNVFRHNGNIKPAPQPPRQRSATG